jgi:hypothetical protein
MSGQSYAKWGKRDDVALALFVAWFPSQVDGRGMDNMPESVAKASMEQAFKLADIFMSVWKAGTP